MCSNLFIIGYYTTVVHEGILSAIQHSIKYRNTEQLRHRLSEPRVKLDAGTWPFEDSAPRLYNSKDSNKKSLKTTKNTFVWELLWPSRNGH